MIRVAPALAIILTTIAVAPASAQESGPPLVQYTQASWTEKDGLPSSLIWAITQDRDGYLWLGTDAGLVRFDGVRFVPWDGFGGTALPAGAVRALLASADGGVWIGLEGGGVSHLFEGRLANYGPPDGVPEDVLALFQDREGTVWAGGRFGLSRFRNNRWEPLVTAPGLPQNPVIRSFYEDRRGTLWFTIGLRVFYRLQDTDSFARVPLPFPVGAMTGDGAGSIWIVSREHGIQKLSVSNLNPTPAKKPPGWESVNSWSLRQDHRGDLWVATLGSGVVRFSDPEENTAPRTEFLTREDGLTSSVVRSLFEDREGNIWVATQAGLNRLSENRVVDRDLFSVGEEIEGARSVTAAKDGSVWVGTENGLYRFVPGNLKRYDERDGLLGVTPGAGVAVGAVHSDETGAIWAATMAGGVARFKDGRFLPVVIGRPSGVTAITTDLDGGVWLCDGSAGLFLWKDGTLTDFDMTPEIRGRIPLTAVTARNGSVWIGFADGALVVYQDGTFRSYSKADGLPGGGVATLFEDRAGGMWIGTDNGLSRFEGERFLSLSAGTELPVRNVRAIVEDEQGDLWLGVSTGIVRLKSSEFAKAVLDPSYQIRYALYDRSDGLRGLPTSVRGNPTAALASDGRLWFVTNNGLAVLDPSWEKKAPLPPPVRIERVIADDRLLDAVPQIRLPPLTSRVQIDYTGLSFTAPTKVRFRYLLEGFDRGWVEAGTRRQAFYTNLPPRGYRFRVIASNEGVWNEAGAVWDFSVQPMFYQTGWFYATCLTTVALAVVIAWRLRIRRVHGRFSLLYAERTRIAREIHDTLLQSLVGVAMQFEILAKEIDSSPQSAKQKFRRLRKLIEAHVREARQSIWDLRSPTLEKRDLATALQQLGKATTAGKGLRFELNVSGTPQERVPRVEETLLRIGQEAISNAVRHAQATHIRAQLCYMDRAVSLQVADNGRGFNLEASVWQAEGHWGLASMQERAEQIGGKFSLKSGLGNGTVIDVVTPLPEPRTHL